MEVNYSLFFSTLATPQWQTKGLLPTKTNFEYNYQSA